MTTNFTEQIASWKHTFWFYFFSSVYLCQSYKYISVLFSILQILRGHMSILWHEAEKDMRMYVKYTVPTLTRWTQDYYATALFLKRDYFMTS